MNLRLVRSSFLALASAAVLALAGCSDDEDDPIVEPSCTDGILNGSETDVDCGGADCDACALDDGCSAGTDCESGLCGSAGTCVECTEASTCPAPDASLDAECAAAACNASGRCEITFVAEGTAVTAQTEGDCLQLECDGSGHAADAPLDTDLPVDGDPCTQDLCSQGVASNPDEAYGATCGTDSVCDGAGACVSPQADLEAVLAPDAVLPLTVTGALVTYVRPEDMGGDLAGFFVQASTTGPALFVQMPDVALDPLPAVGDAVSFSVDELTDLVGVKTVTLFSDFAVASVGNDVEALVQDLSGAADIVSALDSYTSELATVEGTIAGTSSSAGTPFVKFKLATAGFTPPSSGPTLYLRLESELAGALDLVPFCTVGVGPVPLWRYNLDAQANVWQDADLVSVDCPAPQVVSASAPGSTKVVVAFDRHIDPASVLPDGSQFTFDGGLVAFAAVANDKVVVVTLDAAMADQTYTVTVDGTIMDTAGGALDAAASTATFAGYVCRQTVVISEVYGGGGNSGALYKNDFIELHNRGADAVDVTGWSVQYASATGTTWNLTELTGSIPAGGFFLVQEKAGAGGTLDLPTPDAIGTIAMGASAAKVALVSNATALTVSCPTDDTSVIDLVGYGTADCFEGSVGPATSNTFSISRQETTDDNQLLACVDTDVNAGDFVTTTPPNPSNSAAAGRICVCQ